MSAPTHELTRAGIGELSALVADLQLRSVDIAAELDALARQPGGDPIGLLDASRALHRAAFALATLDLDEIEARAAGA